jgi:hypothetical protein
MLTVLSEKFNHFQTRLFYNSDKIIPCLQHDAPMAQVGISMGRHKWVGIVGRA